MWLVLLGLAPAHLAPQSPARKDDEGADRLAFDFMLLADHSRLRHARMIHENVIHMSGTSVTYVPGLYTHHLPVRTRSQEGQGISFMAVGAYNEAVEKLFFKGRRWPFSGRPSPAFQFGAFQSLSKKVPDTFSPCWRITAASATFVDVSEESHAPPVRSPEKEIVFDLSHSQLI